MRSSRRINLSASALQDYLPDGGPRRPIPRAACERCALLRLRFAGDICLSDDPGHRRVSYDRFARRRRRAGMVIAATPTITQKSPIRVVGAGLSPRNAAPMATPIGTRR
jgi:hypothetical protein